MMNFITYEAAYSLYPRATFEDHQNLELAVLPMGTRSLGRNAERGWRTISSLWPHSVSIPREFFVGAARSSTDKMTWRVSLDGTGVQTPPLLSISSAPRTADPSTFNSWVLSETSSGWSVAPQMVMLKSGVLRYTYTCATIGLRNKLKIMLDKKWDLQLECMKNLPSADKPTAWTWYVSAPTP